MTIFDDTMQHHLTQVLKRIYKNDRTKSALLHDTQQGAWVSHYAIITKASKIRNCWESKGSQTIRIWVASKTMKYKLVEDLIYDWFDNTIELISISSSIIQMTNKKVSGRKLLVNTLVLRRFISKRRDFWYLWDYKSCVIC